MSGYFSSATPEGWRHFKALMYSIVFASGILVGVMVAVLYERDHVTLSDLIGCAITGAVTMTFGTFREFRKIDKERAEGIIG